MSGYNSTQIAIYLNNNSSNIKQDIKEMSLLSIISWHEIFHF